MPSNEMLNKLHSVLSFLCSTALQHQKGYYEEYQKPFIKLTEDNAIWLFRTTESFSLIEEELNRLNFFEYYLLEVGDHEGGKMEPLIYEWLRFHHF